MYKYISRTEISVDAWMCTCVSMKAHTMHACVCVCVYVRERERERDGHPRSTWQQNPSKLPYMCTDIAVACQSDT